MEWICVIAMSIAALIAIVGSMWVVSTGKDRGDAWAGYLITALLLMLLSTIYSCMLTFPNGPTPSGPPGPPPVSKETEEDLQT